MKLFASKFYQTLVLNIATIVAIVVGLYQFAVRAYNENNSNEKVRKLTIRVLFFINTLTSKLYANLNHELDAPVTVGKVAQRRTKGA